MGPHEGMEKLQEEVTKRMAGMGDEVRKFAQEKPHAAVAVALGLGWILANGVPPRVMRLVLVGAARAAFKGAVSAGGVAALAEKFTGSGETEDRTTTRKSRGARAVSQ